MLQTQQFEYLHQLFEHQVDSCPDKIALICDPLLLTYRELEEKANQMAHFLRSKGVGRGDIVGVLLDHTADVYIVLLGILKAGASYVPLDPEFPFQRIEYTLAHCQVKVLITSNRFVHHFNFQCPLVAIEKIREELAKQPTTRLTKEEIKLSGDDLCYIVYTSGSTGRPKGVEITHRSVSHYVQVAIAAYGIKSSDRIYQGFSIAFDASLEEIWLAWGAGATLIPGVSDTVRSGAELVEFLNAERVTVFSCVPTLLFMLDGEIPSLRLIILGGEACPPELINRWSCAERRIFNTYGPTEASVVATYAECFPDKPITIGKPLPDYQVLILNEEQEPVGKGEIGEIYIGGVGLARGYVNQPELMQTKFVSLASQNNQRFYRTGDLASYNDEGDIQFMGRIDGQIKLRGFRIEVGEIEAVILEDSDIRQAVVVPHELVAGMQSLIAYIVLKDDATFNLEKLSQRLHSRLPPYMMPSLFETMTSLPLLASGKIDRHHLPKPHMQHDSTEHGYAAPQTDLEKKITAVWEEMLKHSPISIKADFFHDLGGHSLYAAKIVSMLRKNSELQQMSMLDLYENPTIEMLAKKFAEKTNTATNNSHLKERSQPVLDEKKLTWRYRFCGAAQSLGIYLMFALASWEFLAIYLPMQFVFLHTHSIWAKEFWLTFFSILLGLPLAFFILSIAGKWLLLGKIKPGKHKLWGFYYFRWWLVHQLLTIAPTRYLAGSPLITLYYRLMGVTIGKNCYLGTDHLSAFDLIKIDDESSIGADTQLYGYKVEDGWLTVGSITLGKHCFVGASSVLGINTVLEDGAKLDDNSMLPNDKKLLAGQSYCGSPAQPGVVKFPDITNLCQNHSSFVEKIKSLGFGSLHALGLVLMLGVYAFSFFPGILLIDYFYTFHGVIETLLVTPFSALLFVLVFICSVTVIKKILLGKVTAGNYRLKSSYYVRKWLVNRFMDLSLKIISTLYATLYLPPWFRTLGAKIGKHAEISTVTHISPDLLVVEDGSFIADGVFLGAPRVYGGYATIAPNRVGKRAFVGNSALVPAGYEIGDSCLIGCLSVPPVNEEKVAPGTSWFGSPAVFLPKREIFLGFSEAETYLPTLGLYIKRSLIDFLRVILPSTFLFILITMQFFAVNIMQQHYSLEALIFLFPLAFVVFATSCASVVVLLKWLLIGKFKPGQKPAWSVFVWCNELITGLYEAVVIPFVGEFLVGTPFFRYVLIALGAKIGRRVYFDTTFFTEFDLVHIGNDVALNKDSTIQTHLFEDRVMKMDTLEIQDHCSVGSMAVVLYDTLMEEGASLASLSLLMKGETLPTHSQWEGIPARPHARHCE